MGKEIVIPQGTYTVGEDFPEGNYVFDAMNNHGFIDVYKNGDLGDNECFHLDEVQGFKCKLCLHNGDCFVIDTQLKVSKASIFLF